jgi:multidrug efflux pump subunit AcrB
MPMMLATGAGAQSRRIGTTVFSGMLVATVVGLCLSRAVRAVPAPA